LEAWFIGVAASYFGHHFHPGSGQIFDLMS